MKLDRFWTLLDELPRAAAARYDWKMELGLEYHVAGYFLKSSGKRALAVSCPQLSGDGCPRRIMETETGDIRAVCDSLDTRCDALDLTREDAIVMTLDKQALASRIGKAFGLSTPQKTDTQASVWHAGDRVTAGGASIPVFLAVVDAEDADKTSIFSSIVAGMQPSLLLVPTASTLSPEQSGYLAKSSVTVRTVTELVGVGADGGFIATALAERVFREIESKADSLTASAPRRAWQLPPGTEWPKVTISFISNEVINVSCDGVGRRFEPDQLGLKNKKDGKVREAWYLLKQLALSGGNAPLHKADDQKTMEKRKQELSRALRDSFGIDSDPIKVVKGEYRALFVATATGLSQGRQGQVARNFGSTRK